MKILIIIVALLLVLRLAYALVYYFSKPKTYRTVEKTVYSDGQIYKQYYLVEKQINFLGYKHWRTEKFGSESDDDSQYRFGRITNAEEQITKILSGGVINGSTKRPLKLFSKDAKAILK
jgi:hypothetical protein